MQEQDVQQASPVLSEFSNVKSLNFHKITL